MSATRKDYGITRIDQPEKKNHGFYVRITHRGKTRSKYFPDKSLGGKAKALKAAREHRDALVKKLPKYKQDAAARKRRKVPKSNTPGVTHVLSRAPGGKTYEYWQAAWQDSSGRRRTAKFSISRYGYDKALARARKARRDALKGNPPKKKR